MRKFNKSLHRISETAAVSENGEHHVRKREMTITARQLLLYIAIGLLVFGVSVASVIKVWMDNSWGDHLKELLFGFAGLIAFLFPDEFASFQGYRAWRSNQWRFQPAGWVRFTGFVILVLCGRSILF
jgi:hypothetical protein